ncbi:flavodoxin family protein [Sphingopyxis sp. XHP0097]|uniref:Flavodoxin family protein n=1 Tax=Sphingopyxis jiangsuensis TaxID=2871171 RepID=A0ABS7MEQ7_9SPHN|nr:MULTISPECIES: flavodoxin family protein [Sphingopyxis]MBL0769380.1 flavodoxin family protein [Sphingopyxis lutea]MBY4637512.1 flavodoxin family protein [Sphingopyxis jiangsuensis]
MEDAPHLLIVWHSRTGGSRALAEAAAEGAGDAGGLVPADDVTPGLMCAAGGYLFVGPENLAALSGAMKEMFDRCYYPCLGRIEGRAYATIICAGSDGENAQRQLDRIATGWRLRRVADPVIVNVAAQTPEAILAPKTIAADRLAEARDLGAALAEGLSAGIF